MKIVHICLGNFYNDGYSYQENMLTKAHKDLGLDVAIIAGLDVFDKNGKITYLSKGKEYLNEYQIPVNRLNYKGPRKIAYKLKYYKGLEDKLNFYKPNIIFVHNFQFICIRDLVKYIKMNSKVQVYVDSHADFSNSATNWISKNILHKIIWKYCARIIEPYTKKFYGVLPARVSFLKNVYGIPTDKCELLVMGANDEMVKRSMNLSQRIEIRSKYKITKDDFLVMFAGKIDVFKKQVLHLMDAINQINNSNLKLILFGSISKELKNEVQKRCSKRVQYIGWIKSADTYPLFAAADLACFPGRHSVFWEQVTGQGIPLLVKYWEGTTHIDLGGNVEFLYLDSVDEIMKKLFDIMKPKKYREMKKIAEDKGIKFFSYLDIAKKSIR
jgi:hypothetical protein